MTFCKLFLFLIVGIGFSSAQALDWKGVFIAGDHSIENFDNGRKDLTEAFSARGSLTTVQLTSANKYVSGNVLVATAENIISTFTNLGAKSNEGCLIHMTSHGLKNEGFYLSQAGVLPPDYFAELVDQACGEVPTVILVSACYSGQFITEELKGPNRIIMTAARADRPSFGCSPDTEYTYWDGCLLEEIPRSETWTELYQNVNACVTAKEAPLLPQVLPSEPQAFFGENTADWTILF